MVAELFPRLSRNSCMEKRQVIEPRWIRASILVGSGCFIFALFLSAVFDPKIRLLHTLQALIYFAVIVLTRRNSAWGFGAGCIIAAIAYPFRSRWAQDAVCQPWFR